MAVIVNGDGILTGISSLATSLTDITSGRGTVTGVATVGTLQLGAGVSISSPRSQQAAIFTNNTEFFTVDDAGRVGVGTITPNSDAHPENEKKINVGFITAKSIAGDIDARNVVVAGVSTFVGTINGNVTGALTGAATGLSGTPNISVGTIAGSTGTFTGDVSIADKIIHTGDTNTAIRFPAADTFTVETTGIERARITGTGLGINTDFTGSQTWRSGPRIEVFGGSGNYTGELHLGANRGDGTQSVGSINFFENTQDADHKHIALIEADKTGATSNKRGGDLVFYTKANNVAAPIERLRINSTGQLVMTNTLTTEFITATSTSNSTRAVITASGKDSSGNAVTVKMGGFGDTNRGEIFTHSNHDLGFATNNNSAQFKCKTGGNFEIVDGDLVVASGHGIDFSAQTAASSDYTKDSELLDHYEEGTFTPNISSPQLNSCQLPAFTDASYAARNGNYIKIGRLVMFVVEIQMHASTRAFANGDGTQVIAIMGAFPFTRSTSSYPRMSPCAIRFTGDSTFNNLNLYARASNHFNPPFIDIAKTGSTGLTDLVINDIFQTGSHVHISGFYMADA